MNPPALRLVHLDDHRSFLDGIHAMLLKQELIHSVMSTTDPKEALHLIHRHQPDLVISDISIPGENGIEFIKKVNERLPEQKVLVLSMFRSMHRSEGIWGYLTKDASQEEVIKAIKTICLDGETYFPISMDDSEVFEFNKSILTPREKEIVRCIAKELTFEEIAEKLFISKHTVETHKRNIYHKLNVHNAANLVRKAFALGYL